ncbi:MAG: hypothetical protein ACOC33_03745 [bacterium]
MFTFDELFSDVNYGGLSDACFEFFNKDLCVDELKIIFNELPNNIKDDAYHYGLSDSVVRDDVYVYLKNNYEGK